MTGRWKMHQTASRPGIESERSVPAGLVTLRSWMLPQQSVERCELCGAELSAEHQHVLEPSGGKLACACDACAILFSSPDAAFRALPRRPRHLTNFSCTDAQWASLGLPINLAFFRYSQQAARAAAFYPSPAGAVESSPPSEAWETLVAANPVLEQLQPDVEALLANRVGAAQQWFLTPIDECYKLVGIIRENWRGLGGGPQVWAQVEAFFRGLQQKSLPA